MQRVIEGGGGGRRGGGLDGCWGGRGCGRAVDEVVELALCGVEHWGSWERCRGGDARGGVILGEDVQMRGGGGGEERRGGRGGEERRRRRRRLFTAAPGKGRILLLHVYISGAASGAAAAAWPEDRLGKQLRTSAGFCRENSHAAACLPYQRNYYYSLRTGMRKLGRLAGGLFCFENLQIGCQHSRIAIQSIPHHHNNASISILKKGRLPAAGWGIFPTLGPIGKLRYTALQCIFVLCWGWVGLQQREIAEFLLQRGSVTGEE